MGEITNLNSTVPTLDNRLILVKAKDFFKKEIVNSHLDGSLEKATKIESYNVNPFTVKYLANLIEGNDDPESIAKALLYPRILATSITTIFGMKTQKMISVLFEGLGSKVKGIDIEFKDAIDGRTKYCQVKAGPNTINKDDVKTVIDHFKDARNLARTNNSSIQINDLIVGIIYGTPGDLSGHYKEIEQQYPIYIGKEFWQRLTGWQDFYDQLIEAIEIAALEVDAKGKLDLAVKELAKNLAGKF